MAKYLVFKSIDAFANYAGLVEAASAAEARRIAEEQDDEIVWSLHGVSEFDDVDFDNIEPELVAEDFADGPTDGEIIAEMLETLKAVASCPQAAPWLVQLPMTGRAARMSVFDAMMSAIATAEGRANG